MHVGANVISCNGETRTPVADDPCVSRLAVMRCELVDFGQLLIDELDSLAQPLLDQGRGKRGREAGKKEDLAPEFVLAKLVEQRVDEGLSAGLGDRIDLLGGFAVLLL